MTARAEIFGSPEGEPSTTTNRPTTQQMCEKVWTLPGPAHASLTLRPAGLLSDPRWPLSQGSDPARYQTKPLAATRLTDNCLRGTSTHWRSAPFGAH
jgi:hypothetical protein